LTGLGLAEFIARIIKTIMLELTIAKTEQGDLIDD